MWLELDYNPFQVAKTDIRFRNFDGHFPDPRNPVLCPKASNGRAKTSMMARDTPGTWSSVGVAVLLLIWSVCLKRAYLHEAPPSPPPPPLLSD